MAGKKPKRCRFFWPRFSLWAILVLITVIANPLGYVAQRRVWNLRRAAAYGRFVAKGFDLKPKPPLVVLSTSPPTSDTFGDGDETKPWIDWQWLGAQWDRLCLNDAAPPLKKLFATDVRRCGPFEEYQVNDQDLLDLAMFPELSELLLFQCELVTDRGLEVITRLPQLETLDLRGVPNVHGAFLNFRQQPIAIKKLRLGGRNIGDEEIIRWLSHVDIEDLSFAGEYSRKVAPALARQTGLRTLKLVDSPLMDEDFAFLAKCSQLETLQLEVMAIRGDFLNRLIAPERLLDLTLNSTLFRDEHLRAISRCKNLEVLNLEWTPITGEGFEGTEAWPKTVEFTLLGTLFSQRGKAALARILRSGYLVLPANWDSEDSKQFSNALDLECNGWGGNRQVVGGPYPWDSRLWNRGPTNCDAELLAPVLQLHSQMRDKLKRERLFLEER